MKTENILSWYSEDAEYDFYSEKIKHYIIESLYGQLENDPAKVNESAIKWLRDTELSPEITYQFRLIYHSSAVYHTLNAYNSFRFDSINDYIKGNTNKLYKVDNNYRKALMAFDSVKNSLYQFEALAENQFEKLNIRYDNFLKTN